MSLFMVRYSGFQVPNNCTPRTITITVRNQSNLTLDCLGPFFVVLAKQVLLESLYGGFVLSIFMPVVVITTIGISTLFFAFEDFTDRISVTLSCLIVLAGLYSQICVVIPISAAPKLVDVYFFYAIVRMFFVCIHHLGVYRWLIYLKNQQHRRNNISESTNKTKGISCKAATKNIKGATSVPALGPSEVDTGGNTVEGLESPKKRSFFDSNMITPVFIGHQNTKGEDNADDAGAANAEADKQFSKMYAKFKVANNISFVLGGVFDLLFFGCVAPMIILSRQYVFAQFPSVTLSQ
ncbi:uncharacterized protein LOC125179192 [Hyalella azteca]|uniref:Uncharacterized protein LOC125179192 n=1 Tax=Hyalella azteca TaxID=294128 RepID=A0A979FTM0_HYAAZ|nr:uncharacterized protein LOC125179192 [Hyalella azteca]